MISVTSIYEPNYYFPIKIFVVETNGGSVTVEIKTGDNEWHVDSVFTEDTSEIISQYGATLRITPTGGAEYFIA